ncbi:MAG: UDP-N-acetylglucosamine 2-epimerase (non-hydrolyzing) [Prolixibacteraceae bacterium]|nr:UDP-N-acetylglucosamine 2-epimerase (non-hydrolyzing) [Prolixibacteraceae bacterium]
MKIVNVVGARPNFMKMAPLIEEMAKHPKKISQVLVHTGQHYDNNMSDQFFKDLELPEPDIFLGIGSGSHAEQVAKVMVKFEEVLIKERPDIVLVVGDVNSTIACSLVAAKLQIKIAHVEAGLRSFDRRMPEEINRIVTDALSDYLFVTEADAIENLLKEGKERNKIFFVGNVMIDTLMRNMARINSSLILQRLDLIAREYVLVTLHRPENVDSVEKIKDLVSFLNQTAKLIKIVFPIHPRTKKRIVDFCLELDSRITLTEPLGYLDFVKLTKEARLVLTDSGGIQEETTMLKVPCLTLRNNTERPVTIKKGSNVLVGTQIGQIMRAVRVALEKSPVEYEQPDLWDGCSSQRIVKILLSENV